MQNIQGKTAVITGGNRGLGKACAIALAKEGVNIALIGRNEDTLVQVAGEIAEFDVKVVYTALDINNVDDVNEAAKYIIEEFGKIDILINSAGIAAFGTFLDMPTEQWMQIMNTNVFGMYYVMKAFLPNMIENKVGDIINVSSTAGLAGNATTSAYSASKFAVIGMSEAIMKEVRKHNVRVCTLTPSTIASDMSRELGITDGNPERVLQPEDFAELVVDILKMNQRALIKTASIWSTNP